MIEKFQNGSAPAVAHRLIEYWADEQPQAEAVTGGGGSLTYGELEERSNWLAQRLIAEGFGPEKVAAVACSATPARVVAMLGIWKAGGAYLPLDPAYPEERLSYILEASAARWVVSDEALAGGLPVADRCLLVLADGGAIAAPSAERPAVEVLPDNLAYVIFTSGSTGRPKGVGVAHRSLVHLLDWLVDNFGLVPADRASQVSSPAFDASVFELWPNLAAGASVHFPEEALRFAPGRLLQWMAERGITRSYLPTPLGEIFVQEPRPAGLALEHLVVAGDRLTLAPEGLPYRFYNFYGPTEDTVATTWFTVTPSDQEPPIGRPLDGKAVHLVDAAGNVGDDGEMWIAGAGLARGYLGQPALTAERFRPDPLAGEAGARVYCTGDRVRRRADGELEFVGRVDHQVKIRGVRIEPGEVEAVLREHGEIREAVVVPQGDGAARRLVAYLVTSAAAPPPANELKLFCGERLSNAMVPASFVFLPELPLTAHGKIDRRALPAPESKRHDPDGAYVPPRTDLEAEISQIVADLVGIERVGLDDDFFALGGNSLLAIRLISSLRQAFGVELSMGDLFESATVADLARRAQNAAPSGEPLPEVRPEDRGERAPLSLPQERVVFLEQLDHDTLAYQVQQVMVFEGELDVAALQASLDDVILRHEIYRTTFELDEGQPVQIIHLPSPAFFEFHDLSDRGPEAAEAEARRRIAGELQWRMDIGRLPLVRWLLYRVSEDRHLMLHHEHHLTHDGAGFNIFLEELLTTYRALTRGLPAPLEASPVQFADFAIAQRRWMETAAAQRQLDFWTERLRGAPPLAGMPYDRPRPARQTYRGDAFLVELPGELADRLRAVATDHGATLFSILQAAFLALLWRYTGQGDLTVGSGVANRRWPGTEGLYGMLVNNLVLRNRLDGDLTFGELLRQVQATILEAWDHQEMSFERVVSALNPEREQSFNPLFQLMFNFHDSPLPRLDLPGLEIRLEEGTYNRSAKFDMNVIGIPRREQRLGRSEDGGRHGVTLSWEYNRDLYDRATMDRMSAHYRRLLDSAAGDPAQPLARLALMSDDEARQLTSEWSGGRSDYPRRRTLAELFEEQVDRDPDAVALTSAEEELTYGDLERRANRLAHWLRRHGIAPEARVGVCLERSVDAIVTLLAIVKAGGVYVPLDPSFPQERLTFMAHDVAAQVVVTRSDLGDRLPPNGDHRLLLDRDAAELAACPAERLEGGPWPESLAYVMYTSGSTGRPKGVAVNHRAVVRLVRDTNYADLGADQVFLQLAPLSFDASTFEIWAPLLNGGRLVVPAAGAVTLAEVGEAVARYGVTTLWATSGLFNQLVDERVAGLEGLQQMFSGGEVMSPERVAKVLDWLPDCTFVAAYGPTENTTFSTCEPMTAWRDEWHLVPIGRPVANSQVYVLDAALQPVPLGIEGDLYVAGDGLARGYLHRPSATAEAFVPHPFGEPGERLYRTGDRARWRPGGWLDFAGRRDGQVKIRGFRIEVGEVENRLLGHPAIAECVVQPWQEGGEKRLVAYVVATDGAAAPSLAEVRDFGREALPDFMLPTALVELSELPLGPTGKVGRDQLPDPSLQIATPSGEAVAPRNEVEELLAEIWCDLIGLESVGVRDNFFEVGGHSLHATRHMHRIRSLIEVSLPIRTLYEAPTIEQLAERIESLLAEELLGEAGRVSS
ncbi:MAG: amino acid adenylation domain-containing protein [Acidobacteriota bacterium]